MTLRSFGTGLAAVLFLAACSSSTPSGNGNGTEKPAPAPEFPSGSGQSEPAAVAYPEGPFGLNKGSIIANYQFVGYVNSVTNNATMQLMQFADFYNPHGRDATYMPASPAEDDRLFPAGSQYGAGNKKPTVLAYDGASVWCGPCNQEAATLLPPLYAKYKPCGGEFFLQLFDGPTPGIAAEPKHLYSWTKKYKENFPATIDPTSKMMALFSADAFPGNITIDTTTMKIAQVIAGEPDASYWKVYEKLLADPTCPASQP